MFEGTKGQIHEFLENASIPISIAHTGPGRTKEGVSGPVAVTSSLHQPAELSAPVWGGAQPEDRASFSS